MAAQETAVQGATSRWKKFFREVKAELKKVSWPNRQELASFTGVTFVSVVVVSAMIWFVDTMFNEVLRLIIR